MHAHRGKPAARRGTRDLVRRSPRPRAAIARFHRRGRREALPVRSADGTDPAGEPAPPLTELPPGALAVARLVTGPDQAAIALRGELDFATAPTLTAELADCLSCGYRLVQLDMSGVSFLDCAALGVLVSAHRQYLEARGTLILAGVAGRVARLLALAELDKVLLISDSYDHRSTVRRRPRDDRGMGEAAAQH